MNGQKSDDKHKSAQYQKRITSIIKTYALLFSTSYFDMESDGEYDSLLDFSANPESVKIKRIISLIRAYKLIYDSDIFSGKPEAEDELDLLIAYLFSLKSREPEVNNIRKMIPKNFGLSFLKKKLGLPLFGYHRPAIFPSQEGVLLGYTIAREGGSSRISAAIIDKRTRGKYKELGAEIQSNGSWLHCLICPRDEEPFLIPESAFKRKTPDRYEFHKYNIIIADSPVKTIFKNYYLNPFADMYLYFFFHDETINFKLLYFLRNIFSGSYGVAPRESENIAMAFIRKLLQR